MKQYLAKYILAGFMLIGIDQVSKIIAITYGRVFRNDRFAFSLPVPIPLIYVCYAIILVLIARHLIIHHRTSTQEENIAWTLILAGSLSNIGERIVMGYVKDFIYLWTGVFNLADFYILTGVAILLLINTRTRKRIDPDLI